MGKLYPTLAVQLPSGDMSQHNVFLSLANHDGKAVYNPLDYIKSTIKLFQNLLSRYNS